jgi:multimeric flavodoxin WrbA
MALVLGISGSPLPESNTDLAVRMVLEATGMPWDFIKLRDHTLEPCRACLGCLSTNECVVADDGPALAKRFRDADAFVLGGYTPYSSLDARTKMFMERMYCMRHQTGLNRGKVGAMVITTACDPAVEGMPPALQIATTQAAVWMMEEGIVNAGSLVVLGNVPCIRCGHGDDCEMSGIKMLGGPGATVAGTPVRGVGRNPGLEDEAAALGRRIRELIGQPVG